MHHQIPSALPVEQRTRVELFVYRRFIRLFRFAAYLRIFEQPDRMFRAGTSFNQVATLYKFDVELRKLLFGAVQRIEIALRSHVIHQFSLAHGPFWFLEASLTIDKPKFAENLSTLKRELERSKEEFIKEHTKKYGTTNFPPAWKMLELVSFGCLTRLYRNFSDTPAKKRIARSFGVSKPEALESWMVAITVLRNHCAHHARVWKKRTGSSRSLPVPFVVSPRSSDFRHQTSPIGLVLTRSVTLTAVVTTGVSS